MTSCWLFLNKSFNLNRTGAIRSKKVNPRCLHSTYDQNLHHFALLLWWTHVTDCSTDDSGRAWQFCYPVCKGWNSTRRTCKRKEIGMTFVPTFLEKKWDGCLYSGTGLESVLYWLLCYTFRTRVGGRWERRCCDVPAIRRRHRSVLKQSN